MLEELDEDQVNDPALIDELRDRIAATFAEWRVKHGIYGSPGPDEPEAAA